MRKLQKLLSIAMSVGMIAASAVATMPANTVSATSITFKQGDANGDGSVSVADLSAITQYLNGSGATAQQITRMDAVQNKVIEMQDYNKVLDVNLGLATAQTVTADVYTNINNETRTYCKHAYGENVPLTSYEEYTISTPSNSSTYALPRATFTHFAQDTENLNTVELVDSNGNAYGSGFIVGEHVIATAAHCVYDKTNNRFAEKFTINAYGSSTVQPTATYEPVEVHIPKLFYVNSTSFMDNYDYALIYVEEDLSNHGIWSLGCMTTEFMETGAVINTSGFTTINNVHTRYYSSGNIKDYSDMTSKDHNRIALRFESDACVNGGQSGGPAYYEVTYNNTTIKTVLGVLTGGAETDDTCFSWATRITPTLLRFYLDNPEF